MITTHVLDTARGRPASGVPVVLEIKSATGGWDVLATATTDPDGRVGQLLPSGSAPGQGTYRLRFDTGSYFRALNLQGLYPEVGVIFEVREPSGHYHIPLLLSPHGYTTYRGS